VGGKGRKGAKKKAITNARKKMRFRSRLYVKECVPSFAQLDDNEPCVLIPFYKI